ncbi:MAG: hypothetical protein AAF915_30305 [Cyanobacteria bacterium P01_D01_bin.50]
MRISELVLDEDRKAEINSAIDAVLLEVEAKALIPAKLTTKPENQEEFFQGNKTNLEVDSGASDDGSVVVGFASKINGNGDFTRIAVCYLNLSTGKRTWKAFGNVDTFGTFNRSDYDTIGVVPDGCVLTGIGFTSVGLANTRIMALGYQELTPASPTYNYLDNNLQSIAFIGEKEIGFDKEKNKDKGSDFGYQIGFNPGSYNDMVITGIGVNYSGNKNKVNRLKLYRNILVEADDEPTDETWIENQPTDD